MTARHLVAALLLSLLLNAIPAHAGSTDAPEVVDAPGDAGLPPLDIAAAWFEATDTELVVHIERGPDSGSPPAIVQCANGACVGAGVSLRVVFTVLKPDGTPAPAIEGYNASYVLVRLGPEDPSLAAATGYRDAEGTFNVVAPANVSVNGTSIAVTVPRAAESIAIPNGTAPGAYRITAPHGISYLLTCAPDGGQGSPVEGCLNRPAPRDELASGWDRAPDTGFGLDFVFPEPAVAEDGPAGNETEEAASATTVTLTQVQTETFTYAVTETVTQTVAPAVDSIEKTSPGAGILVVLLLTSLALVARRRLV